MAAVLPRATRSTEKPPYNSDSPRKRLRYSSGPFNGARRSSNSTTSRARGLATPRPGQDEDVDNLMPASSRRARRIISPEKPRYDSAADAAAAATGQVDGYKPREERSWEEFHQDLSLESQITVFSADEVDGMTTGAPAGAAEHQYSPVRDGGNAPSDSEATTPMSKRGRGRPVRQPQTMLDGLGSPPAPKVVPLPAQNPREKLNLPKPSYRPVDTFVAYEADKQSNQMNYVDRTLATVGFQEYENFTRTGQQFLRHIDDPWQNDCEPHMAGDKPKGNKTQTQHNVVTNRVEYDMDEQDEQWLEAHNSVRKGDGVEAIKPPVFEIIMTQIEKEWHALERRIPKPNPKPPQTHRPRSSSAAAVNGEAAGAGEEQDTKCVICDDGDCENTNAIVFCDGCDLAVHQECYGVPYIPEGQWLCRKCQMIGVKSKPVCIFCPNFDGAFKQTTENRWAHLLCAIWIPEVSIANQTYQEPISDVANVPRDRWEKLVCYICLQKMGACIQCGHKACFTAFHVTCAKKAKLYLRQKSSHGTGPNMDASVLKAFCHKHVPKEWAAEHDSERAVAKMSAYYKKRMKNIQWANSMISATTAMTSQPLHPFDILEDGQDRGDAKSQSNAAALKKKRQTAQRNVWKLQSGAPVVPEVVLETLETFLVRFNVKRRKEFVADACKYWTMKRDSRRGAAMLKRLQLQLETFSANEVTRRNFASMGPIGASRLQRRVEMAERLVEEIAIVQKLCEQTRLREEYKLEDVKVMRDAVDTIYFPLAKLLELVLQPVLSKLDTWETCTAAFPKLLDIQHKVSCRLYGSVSSFAADLGIAFSKVVGLEKVRDIFEAQTILAAYHPREEQLADAEKELKKLAKKTVKVFQQPLKEALLKETELGGDEYSERLHYMRGLAEKDAGNLLSNLQRIKIEDLLSRGDADTIHDEHLNGALPTIEGEVVNGHTEITTEQASLADSILPHDHHSDENKAPSNTANGRDAMIKPAIVVNGDHAPQEDESANPASDALGFLSIGGTPWYMEHFDPMGTSLLEERWTGPEVVRGMSEELSEMDEQELQGLGPKSEADDSDETVIDQPITRSARAARRFR